MDPLTLMLSAIFGSHVWLMCLVGMVGKRKITKDDVQTILYWSSVGVSTGKIASEHLRGKVSRWTVWKVLKSAKQPNGTRNEATRTVSQQNGENDCDTQGDVSQQTVSDEDRNLGFEIGHYSPAMDLSFNHGIGTPTPESIVRFAIRKAAEGRRKLTSYEEKGDQLQLHGKYGVNDRDLDPQLHALRETLKNLSEELFGFSGESDVDKQFGEINDLARFCIRMKNELKEVNRLRPRALAESLFIVLFPKTREKIEAVQKSIHCPRCRKPRAYIRDKNPGVYLCAKCGTQILESKARFKVKTHKVDPRYIATVQRLIGHLKPLEAH